jgi:hypothetical protein
MEAFYIRKSVTAAVAWGIIAEVSRHHGRGSNLRIVEMHPGGGQYDLLSIFHVHGEPGSAYDQGSTEVGSFNLGSGTMKGPDGSIERLEWLQLWLSNPDPKSVVHAALRLLQIQPRMSLPPTTRRIFGCRMMAALLGANLLQRGYLHARMGFEDTSGYGGGIADELRPFTSIFPGRDDASNSEIRAAADCWLLLSGASETIAGAFRMDGVLSSTGAPETGHDMFALYQRTKSMRLVVSEAQNILAAQPS